MSADGTAIMAPQDKLAELRMAMAGEQLGGKIGYEVLDEEQPFGVSSSRAKLNETRAIEGELVKSIQSLDQISAARVHLVMPERAIFASEERPASASVTVKTRGRLPSETVNAIRYLVSSAVPDLSPDSVSIVDQSGALLARAGEAGKGFAVVASEVKALANQSAKATEEITAQIADVQNNTQGATDAISLVEKVIEEVNSISLSISGAIEEQTTVTHDISQNMMSASQAVQNINQSFELVAASSQRIQTASEKVKGLSASLAS